MNVSSDAVDDDKSSNTNNDSHKNSITNAATADTSSSQSLRPVKIGSNTFAPCLISHCALNKSDINSSLNHDNGHSFPSNILLTSSSVFNSCGCSFCTSPNCNAAAFRVKGVEPLSKRPTRIRNF
ncbi:hypothetical protein DERP_014273 [Dermatophagoides pteronyssinus]|uniref:Uncharacterized protein n=1 Tax=Dermatophagoides pteronyssinus TaxID=6956 RepID=A0ABQ8IXF3_DERPT|nr:hypothetical protein DERP_014273 [Dermatophagoides pteronyssinus]